MKKVDKYYIVRQMPQRERDLYDWLSEIENWFTKVLPKINQKNTYLVMEKTCYKEDDGDTTELYTNAFSFNGDQRDLYKITKKHDVYDYTGVTCPIVHHNQNAYSFDDYTNKNFREKKK